MPSLRTSTSRRDGIRIRVRIGLSRPLVLHRRRSGLAIPQPLEVDALLDTGAEQTCIDPHILSSLGLVAMGVGFVAAPGTGMPQLPVLGGSSGANWYKAGLTILCPGGQAGHDLIFPELDVDEIPLSQFGIDAIIGRDVLASCVMVYDGPAGSVTLAY